MEVCVFSLIFTLLCVGQYGHSTHAENCPNSTLIPVLTPLSLLVKFGDPANITCSIQNKPNTAYLLGWESKTSQGETNNETSLMWKVDSLKEWEETNGLRCYLTLEDGTQCITNVNLTIYKSPDRVTLSSVSDVWVEGDQTQLMCEIVDVGPGRKLSVVWSRADPKTDTFTQINKTSFPDLEEEIKNVTKTVNLTVSPRREDDGAQYQCKAVLNLERDGHPYQLVNTSAPITVTVYYKPNIISDLHKDLSVPEGEDLVINCTADGNPSPQYNWTSPTNKTTNSSSIIIINKASKEDHGSYSCTAYNQLGKATQTVTVEVTSDNNTHILVLAVVSVAVLLVVTVGVCWYYRQSRMGQYILRQLTSHIHNNNVENRADNGNNCRSC